MTVFYRVYSLEFIHVQKLHGYQRLSSVQIQRTVSSFEKHTNNPFVFYLGIVCSLFAAVFPLGILGEMTSIGTLVAFFLVHLAVIIVS